MDKKNCFVISSIGEDGSDTRVRADWVLKNIIEKAADGYNVIRSDKISAPGNISTEIIRHLVNDELVIADLTDHNPNVFYELAIRHATRMPVITLIDKLQKLPFDVQNYRTVFYDIKDGTKVSECIEDIKNQISHIEAGFTKVVNPVSEVLDVEELNRRKLPLEQRYDRLLTALHTLTDQINELKARTPYKDLIDKYREEIDMLQTSREAGIINVYRRREMALKKFVKAIKEEKNEIVVIGSSLLGLLQKYQYEEARIALQDKLKGKDGNSVQVKFLLTHPAVADLRADQEARKFQDIGREIIKSLGLLKKWENLEPDNVRLYMGTPTIFAIKTTNQMLLNPYAYGAVAFNSPCLIVKNDPEEHFYFYDEYDKAHFSAWDSDAVIRITDFDKTIQELESNLETYEENIETISHSVRKVVVASK